MKEIVVKGKLLNITNELKTLISQISYDEYIERLESLYKTVNDQELLVPLIGNFSAGKSSLINALIGSDTLPVAIKPETSIATELRFGNEPCLIAVDKNNKKHTFSLSEFNTIKENAPEYKFVQVFLNNSFLKEIEPIILVDMPGFNSPIKHHNDVILDYLDKGCHYIALTPADEGTIERSLIDRLREIESVGRQFNLFVSKSDLKTSQELQEVINHVKEQLTNEFDYTSPISAFNVKDFAAVRSAIDSIDTNALFSRIFKNIFELLIDDIYGKIKTEKTALNKDKENLEKIVKELNDSIERFRNNKENEISRMRKFYCSESYNEIYTKVSKELTGAETELVNLIMAGAQDEASLRINDIVRASLIESVQAKFNKVVDEVSIDFSKTLTSMDSTLKELSLDEHFVENLVEKIKKTFIAIEQMVSSDKSKLLGIMTGIATNTAKNVGYKAGTALATGAVATAGGTILGLSLSTVMPVIGIVIMFLPEILGPIISNYKKNKLRAEIISKLSSDTFPAIIRKLRAELPIALNQQIENIINQVTEQFETALNAKNESVQKAIKEKEENKEHIEDRKKILNDCLFKIENLYKEIRY